MALLQGNIPQELKFVPGRYQATLDTYARLAASTKRPPRRAARNRDPALSRRRRPGRTWRRSPAPSPRAAATCSSACRCSTATRRYYNAVVSFGASPQQVYAKSHLVPFGEFVPTGFGWLVAMMRIPLGEFARGAADQPPLAVAGQRVAVNICYEDAFGEEIIRPLPAATLLVNVSNVAWFGDSLAPAQHLRIARMRAVETGRYMLRATNTGVTAIVAPDGAVAGRLPSFAEGVLEGQVRGRTGATPYATAGNAPVVLGCLAILAGARGPRGRAKTPSRRGLGRGRLTGRGAASGSGRADRDSGSGNARSGLPSRAARSKLAVAAPARTLPSTFRAKEAAMTDAEIEALRERISSLRTEHHDLDAAISRMEESRIFEDEQLHRLKKKKLFLKDQIVSLEHKLDGEPTPLDPGRSCARSP